MITKENLENSSVEVFKYKAFMSSKKGRILEVVETISLILLLGCVIYFTVASFLDLEGGGWYMKASFILLSLAVSYISLTILYQFTGPLFVDRWFPATYDEVLAYKSKRREELKNKLINLESHYINKKRKLEGELDELYK